MTECLLNHQKCFLEQEEWKDVFRSVVMEDTLISDRSESVITLMILKTNIPGAFFDVTEVICHNADIDIPVLQSRIRKLRQDLLKWNRDWETLLSYAPKIYPGSAEYDRRSKVYGTYLTCLMFSSRLLAAICPRERRQLEEASQSLAGQMVSLETEVQANNSSASVFLAQTAGVGKGTLATAQEWRDSYIVKEEEKEEGEEEEDSATGLIEKWRFELWCKMFGRKTSS